MASPFHKWLMRDIYVFPSFLVYIIVALVGGVYLLRGKMRGYTLGIIHAILTLAWTPVDTMIGILVLIYMTSPGVRNYFRKQEEQTILPH